MTGSESQNKVLVACLNEDGNGKKGFKRRQWRRMSTMALFKRLELMEVTEIVRRWGISSYNDVRKKKASFRAIFV